MSQTDAVLLMMQGGGKHFPTNISEATGIPKGSVYALIGKLREKGEVVGNGKTGYRLRTSGEIEEDGAREKEELVGADKELTEENASSAEKDEQFEEVDYATPAQRVAIAKVTFTKATQHELKEVCLALMKDNPDWKPMPHILLENITKIHGAAMAAALQELVACHAIMNKGDAGYEIDDFSVADEICGEKKFEMVPPAKPVPTPTPTPTRLLAVAANQKEEKLKTIDEPKDKFKKTLIAIEGLIITEEGKLTIVNDKGETYALSAANTKRLHTFLKNCENLFVAL